MIALIKNIPIRLLLPLVLFLSFIIFSLGQYYFEKEKTLGSIKEGFLINARIFGDSLQQVAEYFLVRGDKESVKKLISSHSAHPNVQKILLVNRDGYVIISSIKELEGQIFNETGKNNECKLDDVSIACSFDVLDYEKNKYSLMVFFDIKREISKANMILLEKLLNNIILMGFISAFLYLLLQILLVDELQKIADFIKNAKKGITRAGLKVEGRNEIEIIKKGINDSWETIWKLINTDYLTGIYNRRYLELVYESRLRPDNSAIFVAIVDVDNFKDINDLFGHDFGDALLKEISRRLIEYATETDYYVGRFGGDEFIIMGRVADEDNLKKSLERLKKVISEKYELFGLEVLITASIGYSVVEGGLKPSFYQVLKECDIALYKGKETTKDTIILFNREQEKKEKKKREVLFQMKRALEMREFYLVYQSIHDVNNSEVIAFEALLRWNSEVLGEVPPYEFIPYAEASGYIVELGRYVITEAMKGCIELGKPVHINLSARQLYDRRLIDFIEETCKKYRCSRDNIVFEITETQNVMLDEYIVSQVMALMLKGFRISLDDFGTGYSNIVLLNELKPSSLKIDMSIIKRLETDPDTVKILHAIFEIADTLGIDVVAEGVDSETKVNQLRRLGINKMQGFYFDRPRRLEEILSLSKSS